MRKIINNRLVQTFAYSILTLGAIHSVVLMTAVFKYQDIEFVILFYILDLNLIFPDLGRGSLNFIISYGFFILIFLFVYLLFTKPGK